MSEERICATCGLPTTHWFPNAEYTDNPAGGPRLFGWADVGSDYCFTCNTWVEVRPSWEKFDLRTWAESRRKAVD